MNWKKNHQGLGKGGETEEPRMYEQGGENCPLKSIRTYWSKLHGGCEAFFQKPNVNFKKTWFWYVRCPIGKNSIANFMKVISEKAGLSRKYTNHCLRVTAISVVRRNGINDSDIRSVFRHKTTDGTRPYCTWPPDKQRIGWAACCMIMATVAIVTGRLPFQSVVHSQIAPCHRLQGFTSHVLLERRKRMSPAVPWHPLLTGSLAMRQWALLTMTQRFWLSVVVVVVVGDPVIRRWLWAAKVNKNCWRASLLGLYLRAVAPPCLTSMEILIFFEWTFCVMCQCIFFKLFF